MAFALSTQGGLRRWTFTVPVWALLAATPLLPLAFVALVVIHSADENIPLTRNELVEVNGQTLWRGAFSNPTDSEYRELAATIRFLDAANQPVGEARTEAAVLLPGRRMELEAPLPEGAVRMQMYSLQWRTGELNTGRLFGPFRPWEFGYLQWDGDVQAVGS